MSFIASTEAGVSAPRLSGRLVARAELTAGERRDMCALMAEHFEGVAADVFDRDLAGKDWAVLLEDEAGRLRGFSTFVVYEADAAALGGPIAVVYSGDTIVDREAWGTPVLPRSWIRSVYDVHARRFAGRPLYWLLITSGFRTYRFLPVFWKSFWPRYDAATPPAVAEAIHGLARERFGDGYDPATGVARLADPQPLRGALREVPPEKLGDPHVSFFLGRNPGCVAGDELVCLAELSPENLTPAGRRMVFGRTGASGTGG